MLFWVVLVSTFVLVFLNIGGVGQLLSNIAGFIIPGYYSILALQTSTSKDDTQLLTYWVVFAFSMSLSFGQRLFCTGFHSTTCSKPFSCCTLVFQVSVEQMLYTMSSLSQLLINMCVQFTKVMLPARSMSKLKVFLLLCTFKAK